MPAHRHVVLYDGVCGLCNRLNRFLIARDHGHRLAFAALQSDLARRLLARHGRTPKDLDTVQVVSDVGTPGERVRTRARAAVFLLEELGPPWTLARWATVLPYPFLDLLYDLVAATRYRVFGKFDACPVPSPENRARFLDA